MERGEWREGDHHTQRSSSFFVDQLSSHTWLSCRPQLFTDVLATAPRPAAPPCTPRPVFTGAPASNIFPIALRPAAHPQRRPGQQHLRNGAPASSTSATAPSASNKPHPAEKSTPVWLAIWRTWAGFANSQLLPDAAALSSMQGPPRSGNFSAQTSASLHPSRSASLAGPLPFTRTWSSTVCAEEFPTPLEMSLHGLHLSTGLLLLRQTQISRPSAPIAYDTSVSPPNEAAAWPGAQVLGAG